MITLPRHFTEVYLQLQVLKWVRRTVPINCNFLLLSSEGGADVFEVFFDADLIIFAGYDYDSIESLKISQKSIMTARRAKKIISRLNYTHFVQFEKKLEDMTLCEFDIVRKMFQVVGCWEKV